MTRQLPVVGEHHSREGTLRVGAAAGEGKEPERAPFTHSPISPFPLGPASWLPAGEAEALPRANPSHGHTLSLFMDTKQGENSNRLENGSYRNC